MACLHGGDTEANFADSLNQVRSWKIEGRKLLVMDQDQHVRAKVSAVAPEE
jgi:heat shock protein HslJ